jgi:hypothetical protein
VKWWLALVRAADRRAVEQDARRLRSMSDAMNAFAEQLKAIDRTVTDAQSQLRTVQRQVDRLIAVRSADLDAPARMRRLEPVLDTGHCVRHAAAAIAGAEWADDPVPHLVIANLFPDDLYRALVDAVPPAVLFDDETDNLRVLSLPPALAPVHSIVTWTFVTDAVRKTLGPAIAARFAGPLQRMPMPESSFGAGRVTPAASRGRLTLRRPGDVIPGARRRSAAALMTIVPLAHPAEGTERLNLWLQPDADGESTRKVMSLAANSALTFVSLAGHATVGDASSTGSGLYAYEFPIGLSGDPGADARR